MSSERIAVCSWSLQPKSCDELIERLRGTGITRTQLHLDPIAENAAGWEDAAKKIADAGITVVSGMVSCVGEDYGTIESIHRTGGVVPDATWPATRQRMERAAPLARTLALPLVTFHAGFIPADGDDPVFARVLERMGVASRIFGGVGAAVGMETGQEAAATLFAFLTTLGDRNVGVNFDPANMLLYGSGDPIAALQRLLPHVKQVHLKDAVPSGKPGEWGDEVPLGQGDVEWPAFFAALRGANYKGQLVIEREAGGSRTDDIRTARDLAMKYVG
jgi:sugar phosphate isomerase/epimerase